MLRGFVSKKNKNKNSRILRINNMVKQAKSSKYKIHPIYV